MFYRDEFNLVVAPFKRWQQVAIRARRISVRLGLAEYLARRTKVYIDRLKPYLLASKKILDYTHQPKE